MEWTIQDLGAAGELLGSIAVLATLGYLAVQTRATRNAMRLQTTMAASIPSIDINNAVLGSSPESSDAIFKGSSGEHLTQKEMFFYSMFLYNNLTTLAMIIMSGTGTSEAQQMAQGYEPVIQTWWSNPNFVRAHEQGLLHNFPGVVKEFVEKQRGSPE